MSKLNPLWEEVEPSKKTKKDYERRYGLNLKKILLAKKEWFELYESIIINRGNN